MRSLATTITDQPSARQAGAGSPEVLILSSSLFMDRVLLYSGLVPSLHAAGRARLWVTTAESARCRHLWDNVPAEVEAFPAVEPFKEFPYNYLRRVNDYLWDYRHMPPSRVSMWRHMRRKSLKLRIRALRAPARLLALLRVEHALEERLERLLLSYQRSPQASERLEACRPDLLVTTGPFQFEQPAVVSAARRLGVPVVAMIPSWDNVSTKNRLVFRYDAYLVWSEQTKRELHHFYPSTRAVPVYVVGAPQLDPLFDDRFRLTRAEFCASQGLRPELPVIVYALGSPNFIHGEYHGALRVAEAIERGDLDGAQLLVRPHPLHDDGRLDSLFSSFGPRVVVQKTANPQAGLTERTQDEREVVEWVNTFRHADVVVNLSSTVAIESAIFDRPIVNLDFDPEPGRQLDALVKDVNHRWTHFKPVAESGGLWLVEDEAAMLGAITGYLERPELHREERRRIASDVCEFTDGRSGERMASALIDFAERTLQKQDQI
jgi:hypothetical protein